MIEHKNLYYSVKVRCIENTRLRHLPGDADDILTYVEHDSLTLNKIYDADVILTLGETIWGYSLINDKGVKDTYAAYRFKIIPLDEYRDDKLNELGL